MKRLRNIASIVLATLLLSTFNIASALDYTPQVYAYSGGKQTFTVPVDGYYKLQVWGAQGGGAGGKGGYATGTVQLNKDDEVEVYVGGSGANGGYNGGSGLTYLGGGATDIRVNGTELSNRIIVAGGGGGGQPYTRVNSTYVQNVMQGGAGGGLSGSSGDSFVKATLVQSTGGGGGTQKSGGTGGTNYYTTSQAGTLGIGGGDQKCGGGGGYYGGGAGANFAKVVDSGYTNEYWGAGGGGSSYIGGVTDGSTIGGSSKMPTYTGSTQTGQAGNGVASITLVSALKPTLSVSVSTTESTKGPVVVTASADKECTFKYSTDYDSVASGTEFNTSFNVYNNGTYYIYAVDAGGSSVIESVTITNITTKTVDMNGAVSKLADGTVPVIFNTTPTIFKAVVAISLPVYIDEYGCIQTATNASITNESSYGCIEVNSVIVESKNDWILTKYNSIFKDFKVNSKNYGLKLNGYDPFIEVIQITDVLNVGESKHLDYGIEMAPQANGLNTQTVCAVIITIGWYK